MTKYSEGEHVLVDCKQVHLSGQPCKYHKVGGTITSDSRDRFYNKGKYRVVPDGEMYGLWFDEDDVFTDFGDPNPVVVKEANPWKTTLRLEDVQKGDKIRFYEYDADGVFVTARINATVESVNVSARVMTLTTSVASFVISLSSDIIYKIELVERPPSFIEGPIGSVLVFNGLEVDGKPRDPKSSYVYTKTGEDEWTAVLIRQGAIVKYRYSNNRMGTIYSSRKGWVELK